MQALQKQWTAKGVVWLTVISSAAKCNFQNASAESGYRLDEIGLASLGCDGEGGEAGSLGASRKLFKVFPRCLDPRDWTCRSSHLNLPDNCQQV
jgi:hypothetical protein